MGQSSAKPAADKESKNTPAGAAAAAPPAAVPAAASPRAPDGSPAKKVGAPVSRQARLSLISNPPTGPASVKGPKVASEPTSPAVVNGKKMGAPVPRKLRPSVISNPGGDDESKSAPNDNATSQLAIPSAASFGTKPDASQHEKLVTRTRRSSSRSPRRDESGTFSTTNMLMPTDLSVAQYRFTTTTGTTNPSVTSPSSTARDDTIKEGATRGRSSSPRGPTSDGSPSNGQWGGKDPEARLVELLVEGRYEESLRLKRLLDGRIEINGVMPPLSRNSMQPTATYGAALGSSSDDPAIPSSRIPTWSQQRLVELAEDL